MAEKKLPSPIFSKVYASKSNVTYELHSLGWKAFQDLCGVILSEVFGQTYQVFAPGNDGGRDGAFRGTWKAKGNEEFKGSFTIQCKHTCIQNKSITVSGLKEELEKAKELKKNGLADSYILITNFSLKGKQDQTITNAFKKIGIKRFAIFGAEWISSAINKYSSLRMLVPRVYGLGDLGQILDQRAYEQAEQLFSSLKEELTKFVPTSAYRKSAKALSEHGFVCLLGEPACGKTSISRALALFAADEWKCATIKTDYPKEFKLHWNPNEPRQLFWVDDAFGVTQYQRETTEQWNHFFPLMQAAILKGARVIFTSRDYIFQRARSDIKESAFPLLSESQVIIRVQELSNDEKEEILYNHIKGGDQTKSYKNQIKPFLPDAARHPKFLPEIARRLGTKYFTKNLYLVWAEILNFIENPHDFLMEIVRNLGPDEQAALASIFMKGGKVGSPLKMGPEETHTIEILGSSDAGVRKSLKAMKNSLVKLEQLEDGKWWSYQHPTIRDAFSSLVMESDELLGIYLSGTPTEKLLGEVTCGEMGIKGVSVIVPSDKFAEIIQRIEGLLNENTWKSIDNAYWFLSYRCSGLFIKKFLESNPDFPERLVNFGSYIYAVSEVSLLKTLHEYKVLPASIHGRVVENFKKLAVQTPDSGFFNLHGKEGSFLSTEDIREIMEYVVTHLIFHLDDTLEEWEDNYKNTSDEDAESYFDPLEEDLNRYLEYFNEFQPEFDYEIGKIESTLSALNDLVESMKEEEKAKEEYGIDIPKPSSANEDMDESEIRSRFDDVDE